jgi:hypothetical protein
MKTSWEQWVGETLGRRALVEPSETTLRRAIAVGETPRRNLPIWLSAAAVVVVGIAGALLLIDSGAPELPARSGGGMLRSSVIETVTPGGRLKAMPSRFAWQPVESAASYVVTLYEVDDSVLFRTTVESSELALPADVASDLHDAVRYRWDVEALDATGAVVGRSQRVEFELRR